MKVKYIAVALASLGIAAVVASVPAQQFPRTSGADSLTSVASGDQPESAFFTDVTSNHGGSSSISLGGQTLQSLFDPASRARSEFSQAVSAERAKLASLESALAHESSQLKRNLESAQSDAQRSEIRMKLTENIGKQFDLRQKRHGIEIEALETQVKKLKELVRKRQEAREEIISRRVEQTLREAVGLGW